MNLTLPELLGVSGLILNAGALVWGAAKLTAAVDNLKELVGKLERILNSNTTDISDLHARVLVLERLNKIV